MCRRVVPRAGVEPARPFGQWILSLVIAVLPDLTKRYEPVFTRLAVVKVSLRLAWYQHVPHHLSPTFYSDRSDLPLDPKSQANKLPFSSRVSMIAASPFRDRRV